MPVTKPLWICLDVVRAIHARQLSEHGGAGGLRDAGALDAALTRPRHLLAYGKPKPDVAALAAAYAHGIVCSRPFVDANKRTGYVVCRTFLLLNGRDSDARPAEKYFTFLKLADGSLNEDDLADWIRRHLRKVRAP